ncbi:MAG: hypothetical protein JSS27_02490 [Planctomycetes bacterium]|nr:hypothetical protein [Planctomycetota bacterium]
MTAKPRTILDEVKRREICAIVSVGATRTVAARYVGCSVVTIRRAALRDKKFRGQLLKAESHNEIAQLQNLQSASKKAQYWRAAAWMLERCYPQRYRSRPVDTVTMEQVGPVLEQMAELIASEVSDLNDRRRIRAKLRRLVNFVLRRRKPAARRRTTTNKRKPAS